MQLQCSHEVNSMGVLSVRMSKEEEELIKAYCELHGLKASTALKEALLEKIEDEYEIKWAEKCYEEYMKDPNQKTYTHEEFKKMFNL